MKKTELKKLSLQDLKTLSKNNNLKGYSKLNKEDLVKFILKYGGGINENMIRMRKEVAEILNRREQERLETEKKLALYSKFQLLSDKDKLNYCFNKVNLYLNIYKLIKNTTFNNQTIKNIFRDYIISIAFRFKQFYPKQFYPILQINQSNQPNQSNQSKLNFLNEIINPNSSHYSIASTSNPVTVDAKRQSYLSRYIETLHDKSYIGYSCYIFFLSEFEIQILNQILTLIGENEINKSQYIIYL
jgi:hypothetical protein